MYILYNTYRDFVATMLPDESNVYSWEFNIENYIRSEVDFDMYRSQDIKADADAERIV